MNPIALAAALAATLATRHAARAFWATRARTWTADRDAWAEERAYWAAVRSAS